MYIFPATTENVALAYLITVYSSILKCLSYEKSSLSCFISFIYVTDKLELQDKF